MPCYHPITAFRGRFPNPKTGKVPMVFNPDDGIPGTETKLPCGQCIGCKLRHSAEWGLRCMHEARMHEHNCWITLTYDDKHLPSDFSISKRECQLFFKRLRKLYSSIRIRYLIVGEYGDISARPHYHAVIFGTDFPDKYFWAMRNGYRCYRSPSLEKAWGLGNCEIGTLTFQSASYVARYATKKLNGALADESGRYDRVNSETGEIFRVEKEFALSSKRPGIGGDWYESFGRFLTDHDYVVMEKRKLPPPRYYDKLTERVDERRLRELKKLRKKKVRNDDPTGEKLAREETVKLLQAKQLKRKGQ